MLLKKSFIAGLAFFGLATTAVPAATSLSDDDFVEAAWITTRFYGAQRSGLGPNWLADGTNYTTSFTKDAKDGYNLEGGWFDCGDHAMFGQPQSAAAYMLALAYAEFTEGFYDLYTGDYTDYKKSGDYSRKGGTPNKIRDLLEELRYEANFWVKAAPTETYFVTTKGDGDLDHKNWVTPGKMSTLGTEEGGDPRPITVNGNDSFTPGLVSAMLAVMARVDPSAENRSKYLKAALNAYAYSKSHTGISSSGSYYQESWWDGRWQDGKFLAALELYRTTKEESYKNEAISFYATVQQKSGGYSRLNYANIVPLSVVMAQGVLGLQPTNADKNEILKFLDDIYKNQNQNGIFTKETGGGGSFSVRTPSGGAFLYALYSKFNNVSTYDELIEQNIAYLLGDNSNKKSYVVGFTRNNAAAPTAPHHRGYYGNEDTSKDPDAGFNVPEKNKLLGGMIAGDFNSPNHNNTVSSWNVNEVCVDLNAPMVGALGYILSKRAPKTDDDIGKLPDEPDAIKSNDCNAPVVSNFSLMQNSGMVQVLSSSKEPFAVTIFDLMGNKVQTLNNNENSVSFNPKAKGILLIRVDSKVSHQTFKIKSL